MYSVQEEGIRSYRNCHILSYLHQAGTMGWDLSSHTQPAALAGSFTMFSMERGKKKQSVLLCNVIMQPSIKTAGAQLVYHLWR